MLILPIDAKLSSGKGRGKIIRGLKVMLPNNEVRRNWKNYRSQMLQAARDKALDQLIK